MYRGLKGLALLQRFLAALKLILMLFFQQIFCIPWCKVALGLHVALLHNELLDSLASSALTQQEF